MRLQKTTPIKTQISQSKTKMMPQIIARAKQTIALIKIKVIARINQTRTKINQSNSMTNQK